MKRNTTKKWIVLSLVIVTVLCLSFGLAACSKDETHVHTLTYVEATAATCTEAGNTAFYYCSDCGKYFTDEGMETEISISDTMVAALGHDYESAVTTEAACTEEGVKTYTCSRCGDSYTETLSALGHDYVDGVCTRCGAELASEGLKYERSSDGTSYTVIGIGTCTDTELVIPSSYKNLSVTAIGGSAFSGCASLTSITIPNSVTSIGSGAFYECTSLTSVYYSGTASQWANISFGDSSSNPLWYWEEYVYRKKLYLNGTLAENITLEGITSINAYAFYGCTSLTSVTIGSGVTSIGNNAFEYCYSLTSITVPDSVMSIGDSAFYDCTSLTSVYYSGTASQWASIAFGGFTANPLYFAGNLYLNGTLATDITLEGITSISVYSFFNCATLTSVTIGSGVTSIGDFAVRGCTSLISITIPDSVTSIGKYAFQNCFSLISVYYNGTASGWSAISIGSGNTNLTNATRYYYAENDGTTTASGNYWYYDGEGNLKTWSIE